jgi:hypothetical protein
MQPEEDTQNAKIFAYSPGRYPILVAELAPGDLRTLYYETGYDPERSKAVTAEWMRENAVDRHSFVEVSPPREVPTPALGDYVHQELLKNL